MRKTNETIVADPSPFAEEREQLLFDQLGLHVKDADWGESAYELYLIKQAFGETPGDRHPPAVTCTIKLIARDLQGANQQKLAETLAKLQQKIGTWQREGGWIERALDTQFFQHGVVYQVLSANITGIQGWTMAHQGIVPEITLTITRSPFCYLDFQFEESTTEVTGRELVRTYENLKGSAPGLIRVKVTNKNTSPAHWQGLIWAMESRDYNGTPVATNALAIEAESLKPLGSSTVVELTGASNKKVIQNKELTEGWQTIMGSEVVGTGNLTHKGERRVWMRVHSPSGPNIRLKLEWRNTGSPYWTENEIIEVPVTNNFALVDLGTCRPETPLVGERSWEFRLLAQSVKTKSGTTINIDKVYPLPTEQLAVISTPTIIPQVFAIKTPGIGEDQVGAGGSAWTNPSHIASAEPEEASPAHTTLEAKKGAVSQLLVAKKFGFKLPETAVITNINVQFLARGSFFTVDSAVQLLKGGLVTGNNKALPESNHWGSSVGFEDRSYSGSPAEWGVTLAASDVNAEGFGVMIQAMNKGTGAVPAEVAYVQLIVYYRESADENKVCFTSRKAELRSDGCIRQVESGANVFGRLVPNGFLPYVPPAGLEGRKAREIIIPSQGDLNTKADEGENKIEEQILYYPGYHYAGEIP